MASFEQDPTDPTGIRDLTPRGNSEVTVARNRKANAALQLRIAHVTWEEIAEAVGYPSGKEAQKQVELALQRELDEESREKMRQMVGLRLQRLTRAVWPKAIDPDSAEQLAAQREARANMADFAKLWGLNAPTEMVVHSPTNDELEKWVFAVVSQTVPQVEEADIFEQGEVIEGAVVTTDEESA